MKEKKHRHDMLHIQDREVKNKMVFWLIFLIVISAFCAIKWLKWKVATLSMIYYIEKNQYKQPSDEEIKECTGFVVKNMIKDFSGKIGR